MQMIFKKTFKITAALAIATSLSGCAALISAPMNAMVTDEVVVEKTAKYFGVGRNSIKVTEIEKGPLSTSYRTRFEGKLYNCYIYYGAVNCKQPGA